MRAKHVTSAGIWTKFPLRSNFARAANVRLKEGLGTMQLLIDQLESSLKSGNYYLSLFTALTLPDIAGAMDSDDGLASGAKYKAWYEKWVRPRFVEELLKTVPENASKHIKSMENPLDGEACYLFRCSLLHQGRTVHPKSKYSRIIFVEPGATTNVFHYNIMNDALNCSASTILSGRRQLSCPVGDNYDGRLGGSAVY